MNDLISRQAAIDIASGYCHPANIAKELERLPSAVVICQDCIWRYHDVIDGEETDWCAVWANETELDAFCSYGKGAK